MKRKILLVNPTLSEKVQTKIQKKYENNLSIFEQILNIIELFYLKNKNITLEEIDQLVVNNEETFPVTWSNSILSGDIKKSVKIINEIIYKKYNPLNLIRFFQKDLLLLIKFFFQNKKIEFFLKKENIKNNRFIYFMRCLKKNDLKKLYFALSLLIKIEINIKSNEKKFLIWSKLQNLSIFLS
ncbi:hypothetical protein RJT62_01835 [Buchnera aphidicola (Mindarus keteleerifoliae)]|uniref:hypothetical protein n=1 Tax=Buchnera aphidicola TaxID=9 RepID=UPI0031B6F322